MAQSSIRVYRMRDEATPQPSRVAGVTTPPSSNASNPKTQPPRPDGPLPFTNVPDNLFGAVQQSEPGFYANGSSGVESIIPELPRQAEKLSTSAPGAPNRKLGM